MEARTVITSAANPAVRNLCLLEERARERRKQGAFVTEGIRIFLDTPKEDILGVYVSESLAQKLSREPLPELEEKLNAHRAVVLSDAVFAKASDTDTPQGVLCLTKRPSWKTEDFFASGKSPLLLVLENLQDPGNLGTIFRTAEAAGVSGILLSKGTADVTSPKAVRATMSAIFRVKFCYTEDLGAELAAWKKRGIRLYAAHLDESIPYDAPDYRGGSAFLIGNEGNGLTDETTALADQKIRIPMEGKIESLNAAMSAGILLYEAYRQRRGGRA